MVVALTRGERRKRVTELVYLAEDFIETRLDVASYLVKHALTDPSIEVLAPDRNLTDRNVLC